MSERRGWMILWCFVRGHRYLNLPLKDTYENREKHWYDPRGYKLFNPSCQRCRHYYYEGATLRWWVGWRIRQVRSWWRPKWERLCWNVLLKWLWRDKGYPFAIYDDKNWRDRWYRRLKRWLRV